MSQALQMQRAAIIRVEDANAHFCHAARQLLYPIAKNFKEFTTDDLWKFLIVGAGVEPRAMGAVIKRAVREKIIVWTGRMKIGTRPEAHGRPIKVWRSLIYGVK